jgi:hypothetical protein
MDDPIRVAVVGELGLTPPGYQQLRLRDPGQLAACDLVHIRCPEPLAFAALDCGLPVCAGYHPGLEPGFYHRCQVVLSPGAAIDATLQSAGIPLARIARLQPGVDLAEFSPARYDPTVLPRRRFNVLSAGEPLVTQAFGLARDRDPRLNLVTSPPDSSVYATADLFVFADTVDPFGEPILKAQASGLPVLALERCPAAGLIEDGRSGCLVAPEPPALAAALFGLARRTALLERLATGGLLAARQRPLEHSVAQLADGWSLALDPVRREVLRAA